MEEQLIDFVNSCRANLCGGGQCGGGHVGELVARRWSGIGGAGSGSTVVPRGGGAAVIDLFLG